MKKLLIFLGIAVLLFSSMPMSFGTSTPIAVTSMNWYSTNSTEHSHLPRDISADCPVS